MPCGKAKARVEDGGGPLNVSESSMVQDGNQHDKPGEKG